MEPRCFSFGPFVLIPERQLLLKEGSPVRVGSRALEILTVLVERSGELLDKQKIISLVWPDTFVDESNLKVNIAAIRKAIDPSDSELSCIVTVIGRGYRFVEPVKVVDMDAQIGQSEYSLYAPDRPRASLRRWLSFNGARGRIVEGRAAAPTSGGST